MKHLILDRLYTLAFKILFYTLLILVIGGVYQVFGKDYLENKYGADTTNLVLMVVVIVVTISILIDFTFYIESSLTGLLNIRRERNNRFNIIGNIGQRELLCRGCHKHFLKVYIPKNLTEAERGMVYCVDCLKSYGVEGILVGEKEYIRFHLDIARQQRNHLLSEIEELDEKESQFEKFNISYLGNFKKERQLVLERIYNTEDKISRLRQILAGNK